MDIGKLFLCGFEGPSLTESEKAVLQELRPVAMIIFAHNIDSNAGDNWPDKLRELIEEAKSLIGRKEVLVSIDHEGGRVHRFPPPVTCFPAARFWGNEVPAVATAMALELRGLGFNLTFAPVVDVHAEPENKVIGERAFSSNPTDIAEPAQKFIEASHAAGVLTCIKHFPGHGCTVADSHLELPVLSDSYQQICDRDLVPYRELINSDAPMLMSAHVRYPALDGNAPATLSTKILTDLLRTDLGFNGVVITDDLEMKALDYLTPGQRAVGALKAGADLLLVGNAHEGSATVLAGEMAKAVREAIASGELNEARIGEAETRIDQLLAKLAEIKSDCPATSLETLGQKAHLELKDRLSAASCLHLSQ